MVMGEDQAEACMCAYRTNTHVLYTFYMVGIALVNVYRSDPSFSLNSILTWNTKAGRALSGCDDSCSRATVDPHASPILRHVSKAHKHLMPMSTTLHITNADDPLSQVHWAT